MDRRLRDCIRARYLDPSIALARSADAPVSESAATTARFSEESFGRWELFADWLDEHFAALSGDLPPPPVDPLPTGRPRGREPANGSESTPPRGVEPARPSFDVEPRESRESFVSTPLDGPGRPRSGLPAAPAPWRGSRGAADAARPGRGSPAGRGPYLSPPSRGEDSERFELEAGELELLDRVFGPLEGEADSGARSAPEEAGRRRTLEGAEDGVRDGPSIRQDSPPSASPPPLAGSVDGSGKTEDAAREPAATWFAARRRSGLGEWLERGF